MSYRYRSVSETPFQIIGLSHGHAGVTVERAVERDERPEPDDDGLIPEGNYEALDGAGVVLEYGDVLVTDEELASAWLVDETDESEEESPRQAKAREKREAKAAAEAKAAEADEQEKPDEKPDEDSAVDPDSDAATADVDDTEGAK